jgi:hypothetical protein
LSKLRWRDSFAFRIFTFPKPKRLLIGSFYC